MSPARPPFALALLALASCAGDETLDAASVGADLASDPRLGGELNPFSCTTCHPTAADVAGRRAPGYSLYDSAFRASWWGGYEATLADAVDFCAQFFMGGAPLDEWDEGDRRALYAYLASLSPSDAAPALPLTIVETITEVPRGDPGRGEAVYEAACRGCHGAPHTGARRLDHPSLGDVVLPEVADTYPEDFPGEDGVPYTEDDVAPALVVIEKVRHGQFFLVGGNMPLYSREALTDEDLGALLAFFEL